jgi:ATP-dependent 26S proteasome regulatory subunit
LASLSAASLVQTRWQSLGHALHACAVCAAALQVCTNKMNLGDEVDLEDYVSRPDKISAAEISAICQEAGMHAVSGGSMTVSV